MPQKTEKPFYALSAEETVSRLRTDPKRGLKQAEANRRLDQYGQNILEKTQRRPFFHAFSDQLKDLLIIVLVVAGCIAFYLGDYRGGTVILGIVLINSIIGFYQEYKADRILEALKKVVHTHATVIREGKKSEIEDRLLVPGDLVYLEEGTAIPADVRLTQTSHFATNDFILTGESSPQEKRADLLLPDGASLTNQDNLVFLGTTVAKGNAFGIVIATGLHTAIGHIARTSEGIERDISPLQHEINALAKNLTIIAGIIAVSLFLLNIFLNPAEGDLTTQIHLSLLFALGVASALVPQGLPTEVSVALSLGVDRMAKKNAVVKKLSAVEALGAVTVICTDKTGTITKNEMTILECHRHHQVYHITGSGYDPHGDIRLNGNLVSPEELLNLQQFFAHGFLASNGRTEPPDEHHDDWYPIGDPTEATFTPLAMKAGLRPDDLERQSPIIAEIPFDSTRKHSTIIRKYHGGIVAFTIGSLESVLPICSVVETSNGLKPLGDDGRRHLREEGDGCAKRALRVIALAYRPHVPEAKQYEADRLERGMVFAGFVAMIDPPRPGVQEAIRAAYEAHIHVMMITGDNPITANAIAERVGMHDVHRMRVFVGEEIERMEDDTLRHLLRSQSVIFARVSPEAKFRIVSLLKQMGEVVAVTGDGVNDTLSLKKADIGVAMGRLGSDVAKEAAEIVLLDDNFHTLIAAIREGRTIFKNITKSIVSNLTSNIAELVTVLIGFAWLRADLPIPVTAIQILAVDLVGQILPITALTFDPPETELLREAPRDIRSHILNRKSAAAFFFYGAWIGIASAFAFYMVYSRDGGTLEMGRAAAYSTLMIGIWANILSVRSRRSIFHRYSLCNGRLWGSILLSFAIVLMLIYVPAVSNWMGFAALRSTDWIYPILGGVICLVWHEARKSSWVRYLLAPSIE